MTGNTIASWPSGPLIVVEVVCTRMYVCMYVCIEVALCGDAHGIGRYNWVKGRDPSGSWAQYPNPAVPSIPRNSR